jgi:hypothetical protein
VRIDRRKIVRRIVKLQANTIGIATRAIVEESTANLIASDLGTLKCRKVGRKRKGRSAPARATPDDLIALNATAKTISLTDAGTEAQCKINRIDVESKPR